MSAYGCYDSSIRSPTGNLSHAQSPFTLIEEGVVEEYHKTHRGNMGAELKLRETATVFSHVSCHTS